ncbi:MAG TPA: hypothetical protein VNV87_11320 [Acidimicrobiales bacterium]|jgi:hypothetical protein|nr:hypothetical protein [Acidimicrobiales bacterium]
MEVVIDLGADTVVLRDPEIMQGFNLRVLGSAEEDGSGLVAAVLEAQGVGRLGADGNAFIDLEAVRRLASDAFGSNTPEAWEDSLAGMVGYAASKGWVAEDGAIQAHIEWGA